MHMKKHLLFLAALAALNTLASAAEIQTPSQPRAAEAKSYRIKSPDGKIQAEVRVGEELSYSVTLDGKPLVSSSRMGLGFGNGLKLGQDCQVISAKTSKRNET